jgi:hypothetical protein
MNYVALIVGVTLSVTLACQSSAQGHDKFIADFKQMDTQVLNNYVQPLQA